MAANPGYSLNRHKSGTWTDEQQQGSSKAEDTSLLVAAAGGSLGSLGCAVGLLHSALAGWLLAHVCHSSATQRDRYSSHTMEVLTGLMKSAWIL